jgi:Lrp/AsnC family leucine-responsive transcriptional regulator
VSELTTSDRKILSILQTEGDISNVRLAERIGMSPSPCLRRVNSLKEAGYVRDTVALLDRRKLGFDILAFVEVKVPQTGDPNVGKKFQEAVLREPAIVACYITTGQFDYLLKIVVPTIEDYARFLNDTLLKLPGLQDSSSTFVLEVIKDSTALPI